MKYKFGDIVKVDKTGIHNGEEATIVELNPMVMPNQKYYTVKLRNKQTKIIINENDLKPYRFVKEGPVCECGGDRLTIPHHYDWCPEYKKKTVI